MQCLPAMLLLIVFSQMVYGQSKLKIHGYFTQSFAISDGHQIFGIPSNGTTDYRTVAMLFTFAADEKNSVKLQFRHRRYGKSPLTIIESTIQMDWGFLKHQFNDNINIKLGRVLMPIGIYNEIRDAGPLLPFFQAPFLPYAEGFFTAKTLDGAMLSLNRELPGEWSLESNYYVGQFRWAEWYQYRNPFTAGIVDFTRSIEMREVFGSRLWLNTPFDWLRFGGSALTGKALFIEPDRSNIDDEGTRQNFALLSADVQTDELFIRSELISISSETVEVGGFYVQSGYKFFDKFWINAEFNKVDFIRADFFSFIDIQDLEYFRDAILGVSFPFRNYVVKLEGHLSEGYATEEPIDFNAPPLKTNFYIFSLATSF